jgi:P27 family predicted phage terminase small subunit
MTEAPDHLNDAGRELWDRVQAEFAINDGAGLALLAAACEALDRQREAQAAIAEHGVMTRDRYGTLKSNPAIAVERDSRNGMLAALRQLNLDLAPTAAPGRPVPFHGVPKR